MAKTAVVVLAPGFEEIEALTQVDVLRRAGVSVTVAGLEDEMVEGAHGVPVRADVMIDAVDGTPDAVVLPGGMPGSKNLGASEAVKALVLRVRDGGGVCGAICAAPAFTFAPWGLLAGKRATCYPGCEEQFGPDVTFCEERVVVDGNIVTSRAPGTALAFGLTLVRLLVDAATADKLRQGMLVA